MLYDLEESPFLYHDLVGKVGAKLVSMDVLGPGGLQYIYQFIQMLIVSM